MAEETSRRLRLVGRQQTTVVVGGALALGIAAFLLWYSAFHTQMLPAFTGLKPADAALIVDELKRQKMPYDLAEDGATVRVPSDQVDAVRIAILGGDLPLKGTVGFELFSKSDMGLTEFAQQINYQRALQGELARTLMAMSNVDTARIHITLPETGIFENDNRPAKASVTVAPKIGTTIDGRSIVGIQRLVGSAVEGLRPEDVVVLDNAGHQLSADMPALSATDTKQDNDDPIEQAYAERVRDIALQLVADPEMRITIWAPEGARIRPPSASVHQTKEEADKAIQPSDAPSERSTAAEPSRNFPLRITIALSDEPRADLRERLVPLLHAAIGYDPQAGDTLMLMRLPNQQSGPALTSQASVSGAPIEQPHDRQLVQSVGWVLFGFAVIAALITAVVVFAKRHRLAASAKLDSFAERLRATLNEDEREPHGHA